MELLNHLGTTLVANPIFTQHSRRLTSDASHDFFLASVVIYLEFQISTRAPIAFTDFVILFFISMELPIMKAIVEPKCANLLVRSRTLTFLSTLATLVGVSSYFCLNVHVTF